MAALVLSLAGAAAGSAVFGPAGAIAGRIAGALAGNMLDRALFGGSENRRVEGPRLADLDVMASSEGAPIPRVYGRARLSGQLIWATRLEEVVSTRTEGGGGKGGGAGATATTTAYSYFANFAVGLCEGPIGAVGRVWADGKPLDLTGVAMRVHRGDETQAPDPLIAAKQGAAGAPAYRGLAYVVFERLPLGDFGNRIPQLSFEIVRPVGRLERMVRAVTLIPGTTEFGYEPATVVRVTGPGQSAPENRHVFTARSDVVASLDALQAACPNVARVAIVVAWFGDDLRAGHCKVRPCVDSADKETQGATWSVAGVARAAAQAVSQADGRPAFGGTPSDDAVRHLIAELRARGVKVTLYPFVMMDIPADNARANPYTGAAPQPAYPWRGRIVCDPAPGVAGSPQGTAAAATQVDAFFAGAGPEDWTYRRMILHYAALAASAGGVDAFLIGSELKALTRVRSGAGVYPAVAHLVTLAGEAKTLLGPDCVVTYGADWTEYGADVVAPDGSEVRFPLDPLWACSAIDAVGIDYYAPLADWRDGANHLDAAQAASGYDTAYLAGNLARGEAYDWFYADNAARAAQTRTPISDGLGKPWTFRAKDIWNWWSQPHRERVGGVELPAPTGWTPQGKPIWLTEIGCPAVDKGANQPSVFPDPKSAESGLPHFSQGRRDDLIQRRYLEAALGAFDPLFGASLATNPVSTVYGGRMVDVSAVHVWTWDARPWPIFPAAQDVWSDAPNWQTGHWLTGRLGGAPLDALVGAILADCAVADADASALRETCDGYVVDRPMAPRAMIEPLALAYAFDAAPIGGTLRFLPRGGEPVAEIAEDELIAPERGAAARLVRAQETELPREVGFGFTDGGKDYRRAAALSRRLAGASRRVLHTDFAIVTDEAAAARRSDIWLQDLWSGRESAQFALGQDHARLTPGDVVGLTLDGRRRLFEIDDIVDTDMRAIKARSVDPQAFVAAQREAPAAMFADAPAASGAPLAMTLDLPCLDATEPAILTRLAVFASPWPGAMTIWRSFDGASFVQVGRVEAPAIAGATLDALPRGPLWRWDRANAVRVELHGGALTSLSAERVLSGGNAAALRRPDGVWEVMQFADATLVAANVWRLSGLLRGQAGSEHAVADLLAAGAPFVLLDDHVPAIASGLAALERTMTLRLAPAGRPHDDAAAIELSATPGAAALRPLAPVHVGARRAAGGVMLGWIRRTRREGDGWGAEPPLGEDTQAYRVEIVSADSVVRTLETTTPSALYAAADELADFGAPQTSLRVRVAQISSAVGAGVPIDVTLTVR
jgi:hypothetical protein